MTHVLRWLPLAIAASLAFLPACGNTPSGGGNPDPVWRPSSQPVTPPGRMTDPVTARQLESLRQEVATAYQRLNTLTADYDNRQSRGTDRYFAKVHMRFSKPRKLRLDIESCSVSLLSGASVLWLGDGIVKGKKSIGVLPISTTSPLSEKPCLRGWLYSDTDYEAMVRSLLAGLGSARVVGQGTLAGRQVLTVEFPARLPGVQVERVGIDLALRLPVLREMRENAQGAPVFTTTYTKLVPNATLPGNSFSL